MTATTDSQFTDTQLDLIADNLAQNGFIILQEALPSNLLAQLQQRAQSLDDSHWKQAGIGRAQQFQRDDSIRSDSIHWIDKEDPTEKAFLTIMDSLRQGLNQRLFMGLFDYESHFAVYQSGQFYQKHIDALKGRSNRVLSTVLYLNQNWTETDAGELLLYTPEGDQVIDKVSPTFGTLAIFLSEDFPHEVLPANRERYSIAGWFRVNNNQGGQVDPAS